jgi:hypothetical protein
LGACSPLIYGCKKAQPKGKSGKADQALALIQKLYRVEKQILNASAEERYLARENKPPNRSLNSSGNGWINHSIVR